MRKNFSIDEFTWEKANNKLLYPIVLHFFDIPSIINIEGHKEIISFYFLGYDWQEKPPMAKFSPILSSTEKERASLPVVYFPYHV